MSETIDVIPKIPYNKEFFSRLTKQFLDKLKYSEESALSFFCNLMKDNLSTAYQGMNPVKGDPFEFSRVVGQRDASVGLHVSFEVSDNRIVYRFYDDPFPNLKGHISPDKLDATYMKFKISFLLGESWSYTTTKHLWLGHNYTEHIITRV